MSLTLARAHWVQHAYCMDPGWGKAREVFLAAIKVIKDYVVQGLLFLANLSSSILISTTLDPNNLRGSRQTQAHVTPHLAPSPPHGRVATLGLPEEVR